MVQLPSITGGPPEVTPGTLYSFSLQAQTDADTAIVEAEIESLATEDGIVLPLSTGYVLSYCISRGGCTDPSAQGILYRSMPSSAFGVELRWIASIAAVMAVWSGVL